MEKEKENYLKALKQKTGEKDMLGRQMDNLDVSDTLYNTKYNDMVERQSALYEEIETVKKALQKSKRESKMFSRAR